MTHQHLGDLLADGVARIERGHRLLENHRDADCRADRAACDPADRAARCRRRSPRRTLRRSPSAAAPSRPARSRSCRSRTRRPAPACCRARAKDRRHRPRRCGGRGRRETPRAGSRSPAKRGAGALRHYFASASAAAMPASISPRSSSPCGFFELGKNFAKCTQRSRLTAPAARARPADRCGRQRAGRDRAIPPRRRSPARPTACRACRRRQLRPPSSPRSGGAETAARRSQHRPSRSRRSPPVRPACCPRPRSFRLTCAAPVDAGLAGMRRDASVTVHDVDLALIAALVARHQRLDDLLRRQIVLQEAQPVHAVERIGQRLRGDRADAGLDMRHAAADREVLGRDRDARRRPSQDRARSATRSCELHWFSAPPRSPACRADWRRPCGACRRARPRSGALRTSPARLRACGRASSVPSCVAFGTRPSTTSTPGRAVRGQNEERKCSVCHAGASIASCRFMPEWTWRRKNCVIHWSCWSPPGEPHARYGSPSRSAIVGVSVERGRLPGASEAGWPSSSQNICARVPSEKPRSGMTGEECSQPPDGVDETMLPALSTMSKCTVSPGTAPIFSRFFACAATASGRSSSSCVHGISPTVGSPAPEFATAARPPAARRTPMVLPKPSIAARSDFERGLLGDQLAARIVVGIRQQHHRSARRRISDRRRTCRGPRTRAWRIRPDSG